MRCGPGSEKRAARNTGSPVPAPCRRWRPAAYVQPTSTDSSPGRHHDDVAVEVAVDEAVAGDAGRIARIVDRAVLDEDVGRADVEVERARILVSASDREPGAVVVGQARRAVDVVDRRLVVGDARPQHGLLVVLVIEAGREPPRVLEVLGQHGKQAAGGAHNPQFLDAAPAGPRDVAQDVPLVIELLVVRKRCHVRQREVGLHAAVVESRLVDRVADADHDGVERSQRAGQRRGGRIGEVHAAPDVVLELRPIGEADSPAPTSMLASPLKLYIMPTFHPHA